jgi:hypothetical protein
MDLPFAERITFAPVVDGIFLSDTPSNIINNRDSPAFELHKSLDIIIGNDDAEGSFMLDSLDVLWNNTVNMKYGIALYISCVLLFLKHFNVSFVNSVLQLSSRASCCAFSRVICEFDRIELLVPLCIIAR